MLIIGLNGSPHKEGNTKILLNAVLNKAQSQGAETMIIEIHDVLKTARNNFCQVCSSPCNASCYQGTEMEKAFELLKKADGVVFGSPVYFGTVSAQLKAFFDMSRRLRATKGLYNTVAAGVTVGNSNFGGQETTLRALHEIMLVHGMIIIGDGFYEDDCGHFGVCAQKPADEDKSALQRAEIVGKRLIEVCTATEHLRKMGK